ncbi:MAG TPA: hypothetical protein VJ672_01825 [Gemmatimonadaceae bacterium]|nr:hypothetical protein [Gemmatimonadaceae bacterium]
MLVTSILAACVVATSCATTDSATAHGAIAAEVEAFYRDFADGRWSAMLDHFLPAKVTARWAPPAQNESWARLTAPAVHTPPCTPRLAIAVVGDWARVLTRRCSAIDEAWLLRVSGRWKIVHLELSVRGAAVGAAHRRVPIGEQTVPVILPRPHM